MQMAVRQEDAVLRDTLHCYSSSSVLQGCRAENQGGSSSSQHFLSQQTAQNRGWFWKVHKKPQVKPSSLRQVDELDSGQVLEGVKEKK